MGVIMSIVFIICLVIANKIVKSVRQKFMGLIGASSMRFSLSGHFIAVITVAIMIFFIICSIMGIT